MSEHRVTIVWDRQDKEFTYREYSRDHLWRFEGGSEVRASAAPTYLGNAELVDPEQAFVASLSSCHMLTFLAVAAKGGFVVDRYEDAAVGFMEKNEQKKLAITRVILSPKITWRGEAPSPAALDDLHHTAHEHCFIANSVTTTVDVE